MRPPRFANITSTTFSSSSRYSNSFILFNPRLNIFYLRSFKKRFYFRSRYNFTYDIYIYSTAEAVSTDTKA